MAKSENVNKENTMSYEDGIKKTGFFLEYKVCKILEKHNWNVINNRYYIDDAKNVDREIDILAYKANQKHDVYFYTALIISCKKSEENVWAFMTKNLKKYDPNVEIFPLLNFTNDKILHYMNNQFKENQLNKLIEENIYMKNIFYTDRQIFAFQEMNKSNRKPQNDKNIYESIITTIKAYEYEKKYRENNNKCKFFYNFNLISIFDGEMIEIFFNDDKVETIPIDQKK